MGILKPFCGPNCWKTKDRLKEFDIKSRHWGVPVNATLKYASLGNRLFWAKCKEAPANSGKALGGNLHL